ncbi:uncharacterized protein LOC111634903 [Centruroides sculpturatus]|uniref:uncharacterized protein LOC111634903 n=1 Tax=Centruroides sculpturatus TaxID=218467 RepID=UPI000C6CB20D|nr:uncharacterized protein LOC111634903 [Centruroides sculpturatus]
MLCWVILLPRSHIDRCGSIVMGLYGTLVSASYINDRTGKIFNAFAGMARKRWGLAAEAMEAIYNQIFVPIATYACGSWGQAVSKVHIRRKLLAAQRRALIQLTKAYSTTPNASLHILARKAPIDKTIILHHKTWQIKWGIDIAAGNTTICSDNLERNVNFKDSRHPATYYKIIFDTTDQADFHIFTDGSKNNTSVGCSFVVFSNGEEVTVGQYRLGGDCTVFQAELFAILMAASWADSNHNHKMINITTDSASALTILQSRNSHPLACSIQEIINNSSCLFHLNWTRAHQGVHGNERADILAKEASINLDLPIAYNKINIHSIKGILWNHLIRSWQEDWDNNNSHSITHNFIPNIKEFLTCSWYTPNHNISQFLTDHGRFHSYLARFRNASNQNCFICNTVDGSEHYILHCPMTERERLQLKIISDTHNDAWPPHNLNCLIKHKDSYNVLLDIVNSYFRNTPVPGFHRLRT